MSNFGGGPGFSAPLVYSVTQMLYYAKYCGAYPAEIVASFPDCSSTLSHRLIQANSRNRSHHEMQPSAQPADGYSQLIDFRPWYSTEKGLLCTPWSVCVVLCYTRKPRITDLKLHRSLIATSIKKISKNWRTDLRSLSAPGVITLHVCLWAPNVLFPLSSPFPRPLISLHAAPRRFEPHLIFSIREAGLAFFLFREWI